MTEAKILAVLDSSDRRCVPYIAWPPLMEWIREHGADPCNVKRVEILLLDCPLVRFHEFDRDGENAYFARDDGSIAMKPPRDVLLRRPVPEHPDLPLKEISQWQ